MEPYYHEQVMLNHQVPALIASLDKEEIEKVFPNDIFIPTHWHRSIEISLIENGEVSLQIGEKKQIIKNNFTCINSGVVHSLRGKSLTEDNVHCIILVLSYDFIKYFYPEIDDVVFDIPTDQEHQELKELYYKLETLNNNKNEYSYLKITACILEIITFLLERYQVVSENVKGKTLRNQEMVKEVLTYLHKHYQEEITLGSIASTFHISKEHFSRQFHYYVGKTFRDYLASYRLFKAYDDIINTDMTIQDVARVHGFLNVKSFIKIFTDTYHETPFQYRKKYKK